MREGPVSTELDPALPQQLASQRSQVYRLLALLFGREPTAELLRRLEDAGVAQQLAELGVDYRDALWQRALDERVTELAVEYAGLFIGPGRHIALQESVQRGEGRLWGEHTCEVVQDYARSGYAVDPAWKDLPDHLAVELQFLAFLAEREATLWQQGDVQQARAVGRAELDFLVQHPMQWVPMVTQQVVDLAQWAFYRAFTELLDRLLRGDVEHLQPVHP